MANLMGENAVPTPEATFAWDAAGGDVAVGTAGGTATLTYNLTAYNVTPGLGPPLTNTVTNAQQLYLAGLVCSFSAAATAGRLTITDNGVTVFDLDLIAAAASMWMIPFPKIRKSSLGHTIVITLATGGGSAVPKLNAIKQIITV